MWDAQPSIYTLWNTVLLVKLISTQVVKISFYGKFVSMTARASMFNEAHKLLSSLCNFFHLHSLLSQVKIPSISDLPSAEEASFTCTEII
jgi:hypothetical protein